MSGNLRQLACDYFLLLSGIEYALKNTGYVISDGNYNAQPDWNKFKEKIHAQMTIDVNDADIKEMMKERPARQIYKDGKLGYPLPQKIGQDDKKALIDACLTIRNNLFHGGKHGDGNAGRNEVLIRAATKILNVALEVDQTVKNKCQYAVL